MAGPSIAVIGGGVFVSKLCELVAQALAPRGELRLWARRGDRLRAIAAHAQTRVTNGWTVRASDTLADAVDGASAVVLLIRVGGLAARHHDESFPKDFGLVGDEGLGPGGFANAFRTVPVLAELATTLRARCRDVTVYNLVAPLGITTRLLVETGLNVLGVCELPLTTLEQWAGVPVQQVSFDYAGLNHLGWFWNVVADSQNVLAEAAARGAIDSHTFGRFGAAPLRYYYEVFDRAAGDRIGIARRSGRARVLAAWTERALARHRGDAKASCPELGDRPTPWFDRALVPTLAATLGGMPHLGFVNVANACGIVRELPETAIVEVAARIGSTVEVRRPGAIPPGVAQFLRAVGEAEDLAYRAAREQDRLLLRDAIAALPFELDRAVIPRLVEVALATPAALEVRP